MVRFRPETVEVGAAVIDSSDALGDSLVLVPSDIVIARLVKLISTVLVPLGPLNDAPITPAAPPGRVGAALKRSGVTLTAWVEALVKNIKADPLTVGCGAKPEVKAPVKELEKRSQ